MSKGWQGSDRNWAERAALTPTREHELKNLPTSAQKMLDVESLASVLIDTPVSARKVSASSRARAKSEKGS